jgi:hypothetical protein
MSFLQFSSRRVGCNMEGKVVCNIWLVLLKYSKAADAIVSLETIMTTISTETIMIGSIFNSTETGSANKYEYISIEESSRQREPMFAAKTSY